MPTGKGREMPTVGSNLPAKDKVISVPNHPQDPVQLAEKNIRWKTEMAL